MEKIDIEKVNAFRELEIVAEKVNEIIDVVNRNEKLLLEINRALLKVETHGE